MKTCEWCGQEYGKRTSEAHWQFADRRFCSRPCADKGRRTTRMPDDQFKARYRQIKVGGRPILEHRYVMEQVLGRPLRSDEQVHHKNHDRLDNRPENLEVVTSQEHGERHTIHPTTKTCAVCGREFTPHKTKRVRAKTCGAADCVAAIRALNAARRRKAAA